MPIVGMDDLAEVTLSEGTAVTEILAWETEADYVNALDSPGTVADELADHSGGEADVAHSGYLTGSLTEALRAYYPLDEGSGSTAGDETELSNDAPIVGATWNGSGQVGSDSLLFDGTDDYVDLPHNYGIFDGSHPWTIAGFVRVETSPPSFGPWLQLSGEAGIELKVDDGGVDRFNLTIEDSGGTFHEAQLGSYSLGTWYHYAATFNPGGLAIGYIDGVEQGSFTAPGNINSETAESAIGYNGGSTYVNISVDDVRIYDRVLSPPEVQALANRTETSPVPTGATL